MRFSGVFIFNFEHISHIVHWSLKILHTNHSMLKGSTKALRQFVNLFYVTVPFLYYSKEAVAWNWLNLQKENKETKATTTQRANTCSKLPIKTLHECAKCSEINHKDHQKYVSKIDLLTFRSTLNQVTK